MSKSQEQRVRDAASALRSAGIPVTRTAVVKWEELARLVLNAADRDQPEWPTDESMEEFYRALGWRHTENHHVERWCEALRAAMLADPIIKSAIAYRDFQCPLGEGSKGFLHVAQALIDAVNEAGL